MARRVRFSKQLQDRVQPYPKASAFSPCLQKGFTLRGPGLLQGKRLLNSEVVPYGKGHLICWRKLVLLHLQPEQLSGL